MSKHIAVGKSLPLLILLLSTTAWSRVFLRWTEDVVPSPTRLGVSEIVISWDPARLVSIRSAVRQGYRVYVEASVAEASAAANFAAKSAIAGVIVNPGDTGPTSISSALHKLRASHPKVRFLLLNSNAVQPQMKGTLILNRDGVLQATSPTAQPWLDTNLALVRLEQAFHPGAPPLYTFTWGTTGVAQGQGPDEPDYALAVAEAGAFKADLILDPYKTLERGLVSNDAKAWATWDQVKSYLRFYLDQQRHLIPEANVIVVADDDPASFEPVNLLARHNIGVRVLKPNTLSEFNFQDSDVAVLLSTPAKPAIPTISRFAAQGGSVVLVNAHEGAYPWHSTEPVRTSNVSVAYPTGKGRIIELSEPVTNPEAFAQDIRRLIDNKKIHISLWNALTTIGVLYREEHTGSKTVELLNYAEEPLDVQVRVKGSFSSIRYESPEHGCCESLAPVVGDGFTDFVVPSLTIAGRVHLQTAPGSSTAVPR